MNGQGRDHVPAANRVTALLAVSAQVPFCGWVAGSGGGTASLVVGCCGCGAGAGAFCSGSVAVGADSSTSASGGGGLAVSYSSPGSGRGLAETFGGALFGGAVAPL